jgi:prepilin-type N-terminal cleavage/methylation domain-containing protein
MFKTQTNSNDQNRAGRDPSGFDIAPSDFEFVSDFDIRNSGFRRPGGFSLTELLVVIGIIVLAMALAVPALNLISGAKSTAQAQNLIGVLLAQARNEAIGLQQNRGVMFYLDPADQRVRAVLVQEVDPPDPPPANTTNIDIYLGLVPDRDVLSLPKGVGLQVVDSAVVTGTPGQRSDDGYIGFNKKFYQSSNETYTPYGGVILFDSKGLLVSKAYAFKTHEPNPSVDGYTPMAVLLWHDDPNFDSTQPYNNNLRYDNVIPGDPTNVTRIVKSAFGFVLYDLESFKNAGGTDGDSQIDTTLQPYANTERDEEIWLDNNSVPVLINRYNGALVKGE